MNKLDSLIVHKLADDSAVHIDPKSIHADYLIALCGVRVRPIWASSAGMRENASRDTDDVNCLKCLVTIVREES